MTASLLVEPAFCSVPPYAKTLGPEVADICDLAGFTPDPEQRLALDAIFGYRADNRLAAFEAAIIACRQNIKTGLFKQCALGWLFVTDQRLIVWSAHEFRTAQEAHRDLAELIMGCEPLRRRVKAIPTASGQEAIELLTGQRVMFKARTRTGGRGLSGDKVVLDEAFALDETHMGSLVPTLSVRPDPQLLYGSSAGLSTSAVLRGIRDRGRPGADPRLVYIEWADDLDGDCEAPNCDHRITAQGCRLDDERRWHRANTQLGRRMSVEYVRAERRSLPPEEFARERLGWWDAPAELLQGVPVAEWDACKGLPAELGRVAFAMDVALDRSRASIGVAGPRTDSRLQLELVENRAGTTWMVERLVELHAAWGAGVALDASGPAAALIPDLEAANVPVDVLSRTEVAQACGALRDAVTDRSILHLGDPTLRAAVEGARLRSGESYVFTRKGGVDISPLYAVALARWVAATKTVDVAGSVW